MTFREYLAVELRPEQRFVTIAAFAGMTILIVRGSVLFGYGSPVPSNDFALPFVLTYVSPLLVLLCLCGLGWAADRWVVWHRGTPRSPDGPPVPTTVCRPLVEIEATVRRVVLMSRVVFAVGGLALIVLAHCRRSVWPDLPPVVGVPLYLLVLSTWCAAAVLLRWRLVTSGSPALCPHCRHLLLDIDRLRRTGRCPHCKQPAVSDVPAGVLSDAPVG